jgi:hypothetical protein
MLAGCSAADAFADSMRCGSALVSEGMSAADVVERCGEPVSREVVEEPIMARRPNGTTYQVGVRRIEHWIYDRGARMFKAFLTIEEGIAKTIELRPEG